MRVLSLIIHFCLENLIFILLTYKNKNSKDMFVNCLKKHIEYFGKTIKKKIHKLF